MYNGMKEQLQTTLDKIKDAGLFKSSVLLPLRNQRTFSPITRQFLISVPTIIWA